MTARVSQDAAFGVITLFLAGAYYAAAAALPASALADAVGPQGLPQIYALLLGLLSLVLIGRGWRRTAAAPPAGTAMWRSFGLLALGVGYVAIVPWVGYVVAIALLIGGTVFYQARAWRRSDALVAVGGALFLWVLFVIVLGIRQPGGIWAAYR